MFLSKLQYGRSFLTIVVGMPFPAKLLIDDPFSIFTIRHELFFDSRDESKAICLLPIPASSFTKGSNYTIAISVSIRLEILELIMYVDLFAVDNHFFHVTHQLEKQTTPSQEAHTGY